MLINGKNINGIKFWAALLVVQFFLFYFLSKSKKAILFFENLYENKKNFHQSIFHNYGISFGDYFYLALIIGTILLVVATFFDKKNRKKHIVTLLILLNTTYLLYQIFWGMMYFQKPILEPEKEISIKEVKNITIKYLKSCKEIRNEIKKTQKGIYKISNINLIKKEILLTQEKLFRDGIIKKPTKISSFKPTAFSGIINYTGIFGYYNPFTAEAQYNPDLPDTYLPFTLAHESAHQLGYAKEQEANFVGFLIGKNTKDLSLQYSTHLFTLKSLINYLEKRDSEFAGQIKLFFSKEMIEDLQFEKSYNKQYKGKTSALLQSIYDLFLKTNQQDGIITYSYFVDLLIRYEALATK